MNIRTLSAYRSLHQIHREPRILIVEDQFTLRMIIRKQLEKFGFKVFEASSGEEALEHLESNSFSLMLLDILLPDINGSIVLETARKKFSRSTLPIIMVSELKENEDIINFLNLGANDYIVKPINFQVLRARIDIQLSLKQAEDDIRNAYDRLEQQVATRTESLATTNKALKKEISIREKIDNALQKSHALYRKAEQIGQLGHWEWDCIEKKFLSLSEGYINIIGVPADKIREHYKIYGCDVSLIHPDDVERYYSKQIESFKNVEDYDIDLRIIRQDGKLLWIHEITEYVTDDGGNPVRAIGIIQDITDHKIKAEHIRLSRQRLRNLTTELYAAREKERTLVAREIHDELSQTLTRLKMDLFWLNNRVPNHWVKIPKHINSMIVLVESTINFVRKLSTSLRPALLDKLGLEAAIEWYLQEYVKHTNCTFTLDLSSQGRYPNQERDTAIFRIFQESITNIIRHANADHIDVSLQQLDTQLVLTVKDNGIGISKKEIMNSNSSGLIGMRERAREFGGRVIIEPLESRGTAITLTVPLEGQYL